MELKDYTNAQYDFTMAVKIDKADKKKQSEYLIFSGQALIQLGRMEDALNAFDKAVKLDRDSSINLYYRAIVREKIGQVEKA